MAAAGLQFFLLPNHMIDGGVTGVAIIAAQLSELPLGLFLLLFNIPFVVLGYKKFGKDFTAFSILGIIALASLTFTHLPHGFTDVPILAAIFGGLFVGLGVGLVIRYGGIIDGADAIAVLIDRVTMFSIGEAIMTINSVIILLAGFVFGWEQALYSLIAYFVAHKTVETVVDGLDGSRAVWVVSRHVREIGKSINDQIREPVTYVKEADSKALDPYGVMLAVITRIEEQRVKAAIRKADPHAYTIIADAHELMGRVSEGSLYRVDNAQ